jgi:hypothetical protein
MEKIKSYEPLNCLDIYKEDIEAMYNILRSAAKGSEIILEADEYGLKSPAALGELAQETETLQELNLISTSNPSVRVQISNQGIEFRTYADDALAQSVVNQIYTLLKPRVNAFRKFSATVGVRYTAVLMVVVLMAYLFDPNTTVSPQRLSTMAFIFIILIPANYVFFTRHYLYYKNTHIHTIYEKDKPTFWNWQKREIWQTLFAIISAAIMTAVLVSKLKN